jgi:uncharacterized protein with beta-barrel porin domain
LKSTSAAVLGCAAFAFAGPADALIVRDDVGLDGAFDANDRWSPVVQLFMLDNATGDIFFNCTGTLINPRTIMTAAHCVFDAPMEAYGTWQSGAALTMLVAFGPNTRDGIFTFAGFGATYAEGGVAQSSQVITHPSVDFDTPGFLDFPYADVAMIALDEPIGDIQPMGMLLSQLQTLTHVVQAGYGTFGTGSTGEQGIGFRRLVGENMLGMIGSNADYIDGVLPFYAPSAEIGVETQTVYWTDFDSPVRTPADMEDCVFTGDSIECDTLEGVFALDYFGGDALPGEAGTAPGDSGGPLIADQIHGNPLLTAVLSGGYDFFGLGTVYGDVSFYNPLFLFHQFIVQNSPYKYVAATSGDGDWFDPNHWIQTLDPGFFVYDSSGNIVNGVPTGDEEGVYGTTPKLGEVLGESVADNDTTPSPYLPPPGTPGFGGNLPVSSPLLGPGSTGFVPDNTSGIRGIAFQNPAQYFDVTLANPGRTTMNGAVTIDRLTIADTGAILDIGNLGELTSLIDVRVTAGELHVDGHLYTPDLLAFGGLITGSGTYHLGTADSPGTMYLGSAVLSPGSIGTGSGMLVYGNVQFSSGSTFLVDLDGVYPDRLNVLGGAVDSNNASLRVSLVGSYMPTYGQNISIIQTEKGGLTGNFLTNAADLPGVLTPIYRIDTTSDGNDFGVLTISALPFATAASYTSAEQLVIASALDSIRAQGGYSALSSLYGSLDPTPEILLPVTFQAMAPLNTLAASGLTEAGSRLTVKSVGSRNDELVGGGGRGFDMAGLEMLGLGPQLASADPYDAMMMGAAAVAAAQEQAATLGRFQLKEGWGGFLNVSTLVDSSLVVTHFVGEVDFNSTGGTLGLDYAFEDTAFVGAAISYYEADTDPIFDLQTADVDGYGVSVYGGVRFEENAFLTGQIGYSNQSYDLVRYVPLLGGAQTLTADPDGSAWTVSAKAGYDFLTEMGAITPFVGIDAIVVRMDEYTERGGSAALSFAKREVTEVDGRAGLAYKGAFDMGSGVFRPRVSLAYAFDMQSDDTDYLAATFAGYGGVTMLFTEAGRKNGWVEYDIGVEYDADAWGVALSYAGADNGEIDTGAISGRVSVAW